MQQIQSSDLIPTFQRDSLEDWLSQSDPVESKEYSENQTYSKSPIKSQDYSSTLIEDLRQVQFFEQRFNWLNILFRLLYREIEVETKKKFNKTFRDKITLQSISELIQNHPQDAKRLLNKLFKQMSVECSEKARKDNSIVVYLYKLMSGGKITKKCKLIRKKQFRKYYKQMTQSEFLN